MGNWRVRRVVIIRLLSFLLLLASGLLGGPETIRATMPAADTPGDPASGLATEDASSAIPASEAIPADWWSGAQDGIRRNEYHATYQETSALPDVLAALQAPNRAQGLRTYFAPNGIQVVPRTSDGPSWRCGLSLSRVDGAEETSSMAAADPVASGNTVEYTRSWATERYVNDEFGIHQEILVFFPTRQEGFLEIGLLVSGDLTPNISKDLTAITFVTIDDVPVLGYGLSRITDASGRDLTGYLSTDDSMISVSVDDGDATYPITLEATLHGLPTTANWTAESNLADAHLGSSVATAGDVNGDGYSDVIIGAPGFDGGQPDYQYWSGYSEGRAFVFLGNSEGVGQPIGSLGGTRNPKPMQIRADESGPIAHLGKTDDGAFWLSALRYTPFGRAKVKLEWEVKPLGAPFDGLGTQISGAWQNTGISGVRTRQLIANLPFGVYHWRVRLLYHPGVVPFQRSSRWFTMPVNGWNEADLRVRPCTDTGSLVYLMAVYPAPAGPGYVRYADLLVNSTQDTTNCIYLRYDAQTDKLFLQRPAGTAWVGGLSPGTPGTFRTNYATVDAGATTIIRGIDTITVNWALIPTWRNSSTHHNLYHRVVDVHWGDTGWYLAGDWIINRMPNWLIPPGGTTYFDGQGNPEPLFPVKGTANEDTKYWLDPAYRDNDREWTLSELYFAIADSEPLHDSPGDDQMAGIFLKYVHNGNVANGRLYIWDGAAWLGPYEPYDDSGPVEIPYATIITRWSRPMYADFRTIKVFWRIQFKSAFVGTHNLYMRAVDEIGDQCNGDTGWKWKGWIDIMP